MDSFYRVDGLQLHCWHIEPTVQTTSPEMRHVRRSSLNTARYPDRTWSSMKASRPPLNRLSSGVLTVLGRATQNAR